MEKNKYNSNINILNNFNTDNNILPHDNEAEEILLGALLVFFTCSPQSITSQPCDPLRLRPGAPHGSLVLSGLTCPMQRARIWMARSGGSAMPVYHAPRYCARVHARSSSELWREGQGTPRCRNIARWASRLVGNRAAEHQPPVPTGSGRHSFHSKDPYLLHAPGVCRTP